MTDLRIVPEEKILKQIILLRKEKVILDVHLAELYDVDTRVLKQAVNRNMDRFPDDLLFKLTENEIDIVVSQNVIPHRKFFGGATPYAFTETGIAMLSSVLKSKKAIQTNLAIMRTFVAIRKMALNYSDVLERIEQIEAKYDEKFGEVFKTIKYLLDPPQLPRTKIGYKRDES